MDAKELEVVLEAALALRHPTKKDLRDALVDYFVAAATPFIRRGLAHTEPDADEATVSRLVMARLNTLWQDVSPLRGEPSLEGLARFRQRIDRYACAAENPALERPRRLLDELLVATAVSERLRSPAARAARLRLIRGEGGGGAPRGVLRLVAADGAVG